MKNFKFLFLFMAATLLIISGIKINNKQVESQQNTELLNNYSYAGKKDKRNLDSIVKIKIYLNFIGEKELVSGGTGFAVKYDKKDNETYLMTNEHVCSSNLGPTVLTYMTPEDSFLDKDYNPDRKLKVIDIDPSNDLCLLKAKNTKIKPVKFKPSSRLDKMDAVYSIGAPNGIFPLWISGKFSGYVEREIQSFGMGDEGYDFMLLSSIIIGGQSGSPLYDDSGKVVGIIFATFGNYGGLAIPSEAAIDMMERNF